MHTPAPDTGNVLFELRNGSRTVAFARFSPSFPGLFPFRAEQPELALALLEAARPHALPQHDWVQLVIENDAALAAAIANGGHGAEARDVPHAGSNRLMRLSAR